LEEQALIPIQSPDEMNQDLTALEKELNAIPGYMAQFQSVFGSRVIRARIAKALAAFQRTLVSRNSPFDRYLAGDGNALSEEVQQGWELFRDDAGTTFRDEGRGAISGNERDFYLSARRDFAIWLDCSIPARWLP
jgi:cytochrome c peroxidase